MALAATFAVGMQTAMDAGDAGLPTLRVDKIAMTDWTPSDVSLGSLAFAQESVPLLPEDDPEVQTCFIRNIHLGGFGLALCQRYPWWIDGAAPQDGIVCMEGEKGCFDPCAEGPVDPSCDGYCDANPDSIPCGGLDLCDIFPDPSCPGFDPCFPFAFDPSCPGFDPCFPFPTDSSCAGYCFFVPSDPSCVDPLSLLNTNEPLQLVGGPDAGPTDPPAT